MPCVECRGIVCIEVAVGLAPASAGEKVVASRGIRQEEIRGRGTCAQATSAERVRVGWGTARGTQACSSQLEVGAQFVAQHRAVGQRVRDRPSPVVRRPEKRVVLVQLVITPQLLERGHCSPRRRVCRGGRSVEALLEAGFVTDVILMRENPATPNTRQAPW